MLAYILALAIGLGSLVIYLAAFFFPEIHRKNDFIWSGVGLFYALVLWVFAPRISGGLLLGHVASVALLVWFGWQTLSLRRQLTPLLQQTQVPSSATVKTTIQSQVNKLSLPEQLGQLQQKIVGTFSGAKNKVQQTGSKNIPTTSKPEDITSVLIEEVAVEITDTTTPTPEEAVKTEIVPEAIAPNPPSLELVEAAQADTEIEEKAPISIEEIVPPAETPSQVVPPDHQPN